MISKIVSCIKATITVTFNFPGELYEDFIKFQNLIDLAYIEIATGERILPKSFSDAAFNTPWVT